MGSRQRAVTLASMFVVCVCMPVQMPEVRLALHALASWPGVNVDPQGFCFCSCITCRAYAMSGHVHVGVRQCFRRGFSFRAGKPAASMVASVCPFLPLCIFMLVASMVGPVYRMHGPCVEARPTHIHARDDGRCHAMKMRGRLGLELPMLIRQTFI